MLWLSRLFGFCIHDWEFLEDVPVYTTPQSGDVVMYRYFYQCSHCGDITSLDVFE